MLLFVYLTTHRLEITMDLLDGRDINHLLSYSVLLLNHVARCNLIPAIDRMVCFVDLFFD